MDNKNIYEKTKKHYQNKYNNIYNPRAVKAALHYAKEYGLDYGNNSTYNNEADAFKHTYASALVSLEEGYPISFAGGHYHEYANKSNNQDEYNMDTNNNGIGRQIAREIKWEYGSRWKKLNDREKDEVIAKKVFGRMKKGDIILDPSGRRKLKNVSEKWDKHGNVTYTEDKQNIKSAPKQSWDRYGNLTGFATDISDENIERYKKESELFSPKNRVFYENELNPAKIPLGSFEDNYVQEFVKQYIDSGKNLPSEKELQSKTESGELIYVRNYTRADGTKVSGYYRTK